MNFYFGLCKNTKLKVLKRVARVPFTINNNDVSQASSQKYLVAFLDIKLTFEYQFKSLSHEPIKKMGLLRYIENSPSR